MQLAAQAANFAAWQASDFAGAAPCILNALQEMPAPEEYMEQARSWNTSIGFQRQFGAAMSVEMDYIHTKGRTRRTRSTTSTWRTTRRRARTFRSQRQSRRAAVAGHGRRLDDSAQHALWTAVAADGLHQAHEQPVAGIGDLHAVVVLQRARTSRSRVWSIVPFAVAARPGQRMGPRG